MDNFKIANEIPDNYLKLLDYNTLLRTEKMFNLELERARENNQSIFPKLENIFRIFKECDLDKIKVVILGQDVYHAHENQANGIAFSVNENVKLPPSLKNIYKELMSCYPDTKVSGDLSHWVKQGVFLLNCSLTVLKSKPGSHINIWKDFTDDVIRVISNNTNNVIFCLWGRFGESKEDLINKDNKHIVLKCSHPSPLSAYKTDNPFIGSKIFLEINKNLETSIKW